MSTLTRPLTWIAAAALSMASLPAMALQPFKADYLASYMGMQANGSMTLSSEGANKWRYTLQQCAIEGPMRLARQLSVTRCVENQNWGQRRRMLWVTDGCRAEFVADEYGRWPGRGRDRDDEGERLVCESYEKKDKECRIRVRHEVRLVKQKSVTACVEDRNWGWDRRGIWVSDGCRAEFRVY